MNSALFLMSLLYYFYSTVHLEYLYKWKVFLKCHLKSHAREGKANFQDSYSRLTYLFVWAYNT
ncbi:hypothetical protein T4B_6809 [Trichinella pseudospiralis]|uniref:Uncharacterized protein n=2 Tax=Trichinella pseudospiralis TaxID=6337 RepID=A0A0V1K5B0_TRIPS|nr:hypothetical protein T4D_17073 [Trichinella pseudospiralis]KRZ22738.1 hypothetical protein T4B_6809 [Trichinella pseudospiralis]KRZ42400.1 hypothetical protein T4C_1349 [Trichinella pseudospiralis]